MFFFIKYFFATASKLEKQEKLNFLSKVRKTLKLAYFFLDHLIFISCFAMWGAAVLVEWLSSGQYTSPTVADVLSL